MDNLSKQRLLKQTIGFTLLRIATAIIVITVGVLMFFVISKGYSVISWEFLSEMPKNRMREGGIFPAILGTFLLGIGSMTFAVPIGVLTAVYLSEFADNGLFTRMIRVGTNTLAGLPSVVYGLFGAALFVKVLAFGESVLSGALTLGVMSLPIIISTSEEALKTVPMAFREASLSLGATKWTTTRKVVLPNAISGIITGIVLALGRAVGETAPIIFTAVAFFSIRLPKGPMSRITALPYHIYALVTEGLYPDQQYPIAFGSALVLICLVLLLSSAGVYIRYKSRKSRKW